MCTEQGLRTTAAVLFLGIQAAEDLRYRSVPTARTLLWAAGAFAADLLCLLMKSSECLPVEAVFEVFLLAGCMILPAIWNIGIGMGDGLTWLVLGLLTGPRESLWTLFFAGVLCSLCGVLMIAAGKANGKTEQPFLVYMAAGFLLNRLLGTR